jgi:hypothetical protein
MAGYLATITPEVLQNHRLENHFGRAQWYSYVKWVKWKLIAVHLEIVLILMQDRYMVCAKCGIG